MTNEQPNWPKQFKTKPNEEVKRDTSDPHQEKLQINQVVSAKESKKNKD